MRQTILSATTRAVLGALAVEPATCIRVHRLMQLNHQHAERHDVKLALDRLEAIGYAVSDERRVYRLTAEGLDCLRQLETAIAMDLQPTALPAARPRSSLGNGDAKPPVPRVGSLDALQLPSRYGAVRRWPCGKVEAA